MTVDPAVVIGAFGIVAGLLLTIVKLFMSGDILPRNAVRREDYDALILVNASYAMQMPALVAAVRGMADSQKGMATTIERVVPTTNGVK